MRRSFGTINIWLSSNSLVFTSSDDLQWDQLLVRWLLISYFLTPSFFPQLAVSILIHKRAFHSLSFIYSLTYMSMFVLLHSSFIPLIMISDLGCTNYQKFGQWGLLRARSCFFQICLQYFKIFLFHTNDPDSYFFCSGIDFFSRSPIFVLNSLLLVKILGQK